MLLTLFFCYYSFLLCTLNVFLISQTFASVPTVYDAAIGESCFYYGALHHGVVAVCVYAYGVVAVHGKLHSCGEDAFRLSTLCYAVDGGVGAIAEPGAAIYRRIGGVVAWAQHESGYDVFSIVGYGVAVTAVDVGL